MKPAELTRDQWSYKGWSISFDLPPVPIRSFDWEARSPDFDVDVDGIVSGQRVYAATYEDLLQEIEDAIWEAEQ